MLEVVTSGLVGCMPSPIDRPHTLSTCGEHRENRKHTHTPVKLGKQITTGLEVQGGFHKPPVETFSVECVYTQINYSWWTFFQSVTGSFKWIMPTLQLSDSRVKRGEKNYGTEKLRVIHIMRKSWACSEGCDERKWIDEWLIARRADSKCTTFHYLMEVNACVHSWQLR